MASQIHTTAGPLLGEALVSHVQATMLTTVLPSTGGRGVRTLVNSPARAVFQTSLPVYKANESCRGEQKTKGF